MTLVLGMWTALCPSWQHSIEWGLGPVSLTCTKVKCASIVSRSQLETLISTLGCSLILKTCMWFHQLHWSHNTFFLFCLLTLEMLLTVHTTKSERFVVVCKQKSCEHEAFWQYHAIYSNNCSLCANGRSRELKGYGNGRLKWMLDKERKNWWQQGVP